MTDINHLLDTLQEGDPVAADQLLMPVYSELRRLAAARMQRLPVSRRMNTVPA